MSKSLIRKNQLHPDVADLVSGYGDTFFTTPSEVESLINQNLLDLGINSIVRTTGDQSIEGLKTFDQRPFFNGTGLATLAEVGQGGGGGSEYVFPSNLSVILGAGKTFGKYQNGDTIEAAGLTTSQVIQLAITEKINPTVNLSVSPSSILLGQTSISNQLTFSRTINNPGATVTSVSLDWKRSNTSTWTNLSTNINLSSPFTHTFTSNSNISIDYRYVVTDSEGSTNTATVNVPFLYGNYFGYNAATSLTTVNQIESLGNLFLSDSRSRTISNVTAGAGLYLYYAYKSEAGDLTSIIQDGAAPVLGAFTKQSDIVGTNTNGASVTYRVYRSNATQAFTNNTLAFS
jgi:hypothetical protein